MGKDKKPKGKYTTVSIDRELANRLEKRLLNWNYQSLSEFVRDAIRRLLEDLDKSAVEPKRLVAEVPAQ
jgi:Arc/MetJ-type ribon-helix-helix transcriptional regulator